MDWFSSPITAQTSPELIRRFRLRDGEAAAELYERYGKLLFALILNIVGDRQTAEDLLLESLLKASNQIHDFPANHLAVGSWLLILARNHALNYRFKSLAGETGTDYGRKLETPAIFSSRPAIAANFLGNQAAQRAFLHLPEVDRLVLELAWFEGMTFEEIALRLYRPLPDVEALAESALARIRES